MMRLFSNTPPGPDDVMNLLGVSQDDMLFNRSGRMSDRQKDILRRERRLFVAVFGLIILIVMVAAWLSRSEISLDFRDIGLLHLFLLLLIGGLFAYAVLKVSQISSDLNSGEILTRAGHIRRHVKRSGRSRFYYIIINEVRFQVSRQIYNAFIDGDYYHVYYATRSKILLNAVHDATQRRSSV